MRRSLAIVVVAVALAAGAYTLYWFRAADALGTGVASWADARRAEGWTVALGPVAVGGFPFRLEAVVDGFTIGRDSPVAWRWTGPRLTAAAPPWTTDRLSLDAPGAHRIKAQLPGREERIAFDAATAHGTVRLAPDGKIARLDAVLAGVSGQSGEGGHFHADNVVLELDGATNAGAPAGPGSGALRAPEAGRIHLTAQGIDLPDGTTGPLGRHIDHLEAEIGLDGALPSGPSRQALEAWRQAGGTVELRKVVVDWGRFQAEADGTLALDSDMQPIGAFTTRLSGVDNALDALVATGRIDPRAGAMAKIVLHVLAKPANDPAQPSEVQVPVTLQDRKLFLGPAALVRLPRIDWPSAPQGR